MYGVTGRLFPNNGLSKSLSEHFKKRPMVITNMIVPPRVKSNSHPKNEIFLSIGSPSSLIQVVVKKVLL
jgi:hypothetical protein